jgi:hypothetical protein
MSKKEEDEGEEEGGKRSLLPGRHRFWVFSLSW